MISLKLSEEPYLTFIFQRIEFQVRASLKSCRLSSNGVNKLILSTIRRPFYSIRAINQL